MTLYLEQMGHRVRSAATMADALAALPDADCNVLITDLGLPDGSGWELLRQAKFDRPVYAIAMTGFGMATDRVKSKAAGFRHHLLKPFSPDEFDAILEAAAKEVGAREEEEQ
ncbi:MAG: response regulator [Verrucomicrobia bacterium]|nr:response regulator [Verrucomicrobiota bacterium]